MSRVLSRSFAAVGAIATVFALGACGTGTTETASPDVVVEEVDVVEAVPAEPAAEGTPSCEGKNIAIVSKGFSQQFWVAVRNGAEAAATERGATISFVGPDNEAQVAQQVEQLDTAINGNPDALAFAALSTEASLPSLDRAHAAGIPIIAFDSGVESELPATTVATDNYAAAAEAARMMSELIGPEGGDVAVIAHDQTSLTGVERRDGFLDWMEQNAPNVHIVGVQYSASDVLTAADQARAFLQANPNLRGIFATNEASAIGMMTGVDELNAADNLVLVGFDSGQGQIEAITAGRQDGAVTQAPVNMGYQTVVAACAAIAGETLPETVDTGFYWFDATNITEPNIAESLYE